MSIYTEQKVYNQVAALLIANGYETKVEKLSIYGSKVLSNGIERKLGIHKGTTCAIYKVDDDNCGFYVMHGEDWDGELEWMGGYSGGGNCKTSEEVFDLLTKAISGERVGLAGYWSKDELKQLADIEAECPDNVVMNTVAQTSTLWHKGHDKGTANAFAQLKGGYNYDNRVYLVEHRSKDLANEAHLIGAKKLFTTQHSSIDEAFRNALLIEELTTIR